MEIVFFDKPSELRKNLAILSKISTALNFEESVTIKKFYELGLQKEMNFSG